VPIKRKKKKSRSFHTFFHPAKILRAKDPSYVAGVQPLFSVVYMQLLGYNDTHDARKRNAVKTVGFCIPGFRTGISAARLFGY
jgi:hypothetical protein